MEKRTTPKTENQKRTAHEERETSVSLTTPAVRMVVVHAWLWSDDNSDEKTEHAFDAVVALQARIYRAFEKEYYGDRYPYVPASPEEFLEAGWLERATRIQHSAIYVDPEFGLISSEDDWLQVENGLTKVACCPWPPEEDESRLADIVVKLLEEIRTRNKHKAKVKTEA